MDRQIAPAWSPSQVAVQRQAKRTSLFYSYVNLWPFVAVLLVLLIVFMVVGPPIHPLVTVDLPSGVYTTAQPKALAEDAMKVYVTRDGRLFFRTDRVRAESLPILIRGAVLEGAERKVYIAVDSHARYSDAAAVVEQIGNAGIREICILAYKREE